MGFLTLAEFLLPSISDIDPSSEDPYIHPMMRFLVKMLGLPTLHAPRRSAETVEEDGQHMRRLAGAAIQPRRLYSNSNDDEDQTLRLIIRFVTSTIPPFIFTGSFIKTPGIMAGPLPSE